MPEITEVNIDDLKPAEYNPRIEMPVKEMKALKKSMVEFGCCEPVVINMNNTVIGGHQRIKAARELGWDKIPCIYLDLTPAKEKALNLALNKIRGDWDYEKLKDVLEELHGLEEIDFELTGFDESELKELISGDLAGKTDPDAIPEPPEEPITKPGDLWILGDHRLLCGDATKKEDVARLMDGKKADCVVTDPPYGMNYHGQTFGKDGIANDTESEFEGVLFSAVECAKVSDALWAICFGTSRLDAYFRATASLVFHRMLTIYKPNRVAYPWRGWILTSELIGLFSTGKPTWGSGPSCHDVYTFDYSDRPDRSVDHPTVKPIKIITDVMQKIGGSIVYDPFLGSGTTLIAAEQLGRKCYGMEIEPRYVDVAVKRWEDFTGKTAHLQD